MYRDKPLLDGESIVCIDSKGFSWESDKYDLKYNDASNDD